MIVYTDQLDQLKKVVQSLTVKRAEPLVIKGEKVDLIWPPRTPELPLDILEVMPSGAYVILKGNTITIVP
ncbi:MAG: hypothetical protein ABWJ97_06530 [Thermoproteus sp.]